MSTLSNKQKKQQIINAAIDLFAEKGIANISVARIAKEIGASKGKVYHHFKRGKSDIIAAILQEFEDCVSDSIPNRTEWEAKDADARQILFGLFVEFPAEDALRLRKITRIILSEMFNDEQIKQHARNGIILERERMLADCIQALAGNGKIAPIDAKSAARFLNRLILVYAIEDAMLYPFTQDIRDEESNNRAILDCTNFINMIMTRN